MSKNLKSKLNHEFMKMIWTKMKKIKKKIQFKTILAESFGLQNPREMSLQKILQDQAK